MTFLPQNPDLSLGNVRPGVFVAVNLDAPGGGVGDIQRRLLIAAYKLASGAYAQDAPIQPLAQAEVDAGCGARSDAARGFKAALAQVGAGNIDIYVLPLVEPAGGTAATYNLVVAFSSGSSAAAPGSIDLLIDGRPILTVGFATGDSGPVIAAALKTEIDALTDIPVTTGIASSTITLTYVHKGAVGEDCPIRARINEASGPGSTKVLLSPGSIKFGGPSVGAGSIQIKICGVTITTPLAGGESASQIATLVQASIASGNYPVTAAVNSGDNTQVDLFFAPGRDWRRSIVTVITSTGVTIDITSQGTAGSGSPTLTAALANLSSLPGFKGWAVPFLGTQASPDTTTLGTIASYVEPRANGVGQQEQNIHACAPWPVATLGTIPVGTAPALTSSPRYAILWAQDFGTQGFEIACRMAAARVNNDYAAQNWDGYELLSSAASPLVLPAPASRPSGDQINLAMRSYFLTPIRVDEGSNTAVVEKGTTTSNSTYLPLRDFATIDQVAFWRVSLAQRMVDKFRQVSGKRFSPPRTPHTISEESVGQEAYQLALEWDELDLYDGAETFKDGFKSKFNAQQPSRIDLTFPMSPVINVHQIGAIGNLVSGARPSQ